MDAERIADRRRSPDYVTKVAFTEAIDGIHSRLDKQDGKLETLDAINTHMRVMCNIAKWGWKIAGVVGAILVFGHQMGRW
jgi:hypothetical protein